MAQRFPRLARAGLVAVLLGGTALGGMSLGGTTLGGTILGSPALADTRADAAPIQPSPTLHPLPDFSDLAAQVSPAVVSVTVREKPGAAPEGLGRHGMGSEAPAGAVRQARGSGFIIDPTGVIVTNNHVVKDADTVSVTLTDGTELPAKVVGRDARTDLAVIKVQAGHPLPSLTLGDSDQVRPGQWVLAVGNPFGLGGTVTAGIVSARGRDIGAGPYDAFLQVDAAINQGNSGGPLFTQDGRVVGVNTAILSPSGGSIGIGFAIPSSLVKDVVGQLRTAGHVTRGFLGVETQPVTAGIAPGLGLAQDAKGALVAAVSPDSPAAKGGLKPGDVLQSVDGKPVSSPHDLALLVSQIAPGRTAALGVLHDAKAETVSIKLTAMPDDQQVANAATASPGRGTIGVALAPLSPELRDQLELAPDQRGVVIAGVQPGSPAAAAGLREGDLVVGVGKDSVGAPSEAVSAIRGAAQDGRTVALRILRNGQARFIAVSPGAQG